MTMGVARETGLASKSLFVSQVENSDIHEWHTISDVFPWTPCVFNLNPFGLCYSDNWRVIHMNQNSDHMHVIWQ